MEPKAVVLVSGGLDSATCLAQAKLEGFDCYPISFAYGQRHIAELEAAKRICIQLQVREAIRLELPTELFAGTALVDRSLTIPTGEVGGLPLSDQIPITYVPARNTIFLSMALGFSESLGAQDIFIGVNAVDYSGYPDCRPAFIQAFEQLANLATKRAVNGVPFRIHAPLLNLQKSEVIRLGAELGVDYSQTVSCYQADAFGRACGECDSCRFRAHGFAEAGLADPTVYMD